MSKGLEWNGNVGKLSQRGTLRKERGRKIILAVCVVVQLVKLLFGIPAFLKELLV